MTKRSPKTEKERLDASLALLQNPDLSIHDVAIAVEFNPSNFSARFKELFAITASEYRTNFFLNHPPPIVRKIQNYLFENFRLTQIAEEIGMDRQTLSYTFKKYTGETPLEWKNNHEPSTETNTLKIA